MSCDAIGSPALEELCSNLSADSSLRGELLIVSLAASFNYSWPNSKCINYFRYYILQSCSIRIITHLIHYVSSTHDCTLVVYEMFDAASKTYNDSECK